MPVQLLHPLNGLSTASPNVATAFPVDGIYLSSGSFVNRPISIATFMLFYLPAYVIVFKVQASIHPT